MSEEKLIGLAELIQQVKQELLMPAPDKDKELPVFAVDSVELELQVTMRKDVKAGIKIYVLEMGGGTDRDDVQKVKVQLSPLLSKEQMVAYYQQRYPERWNDFVEQIATGATKGSSDVSDLI